ncbi:MAG: creatininase family protein, partial [Acidimicrobiaceae bacterium]|nr:creatininase family protein [Acidimicrobiaceae bacterium]
MPDPHSRRLEDLSGPEITDRITESSVIVQPIGAVEQHGPHLPLSVDHVIAHESAAALVAEHGDAYDLWLLPTLSV